jgi:hypothetical protein
MAQRAIRFDRAGRRLKLSFFSRFQKLFQQLALAR